ncbi:MAG: hypothetical protein KAS32_00135 [Candidatus Peribacteraceae bacterium]|nr:hypothetical protein [Candidatus Peribacteraceae bacterium]
MTKLKNRTKSVQSVELSDGRVAGIGDVVVDTKGFHDAQIVAVFGTTVATGSIKLFESDASGGSFTQAVDADGVDIEIPYGSGDADSILTLAIENLNLNLRKRFYRLDTVTGTADICGIIQLGSPDTAPTV